MSSNDIAVRYRTAGGAIVTVYGRICVYRAECGGCRERSASFDSKRWAQNHAACCMALPR
ncbi:hypothetical protein [Streptomyces sp. NBC_01207]|uniref:hypothetical protein n=1 Tax=Streptomyces sp. NBC_01207 TaxID=2903772 RepID=UPI002E1188DE|nr:hypothetical protein OG457_23710 [Streptomyces sp. NBC_01207]